jgi:Mg2+ and Co2+ transporter CorA
MSLGVVNNCIKAMTRAYHETFTDPFWEGRHPTLWPHPAPLSQDGVAYKDRMCVLRGELEKVIRELSDVYSKNEATRTEIQSLREQLFSGSSIKESRRAIDQGDNIRILTLSSMIFLPLTFVTVSRLPSTWGNGERQTNRSRSQLSQSSA